MQKQYGYACQTDLGAYKFCSLKHHGSLYFSCFRMQNEAENNFSGCLDWEREVNWEGKQMETINDILGTIE